MGLRIVYSKKEISSQVVFSWLFQNRGYSASSSLLTNTPPKSPPSTGGTQEALAPNRSPPR
jgi:hypothetical protein